MKRRCRGPVGRRLLGGSCLGLCPEGRRLARLLALTRLYQRSGLQRLVRGSGLPRSFPRFGAMDRLLPTLPSRLSAPPLAVETLPADGSPHGTVALLEGCVQAVLFPEVNRATVNLLARAGFRVVVPAGQGCCGALPLHWGDRAAGRATAQRNLAAFADADWIVTNAAGCGAALRDYGHLLGDDPRAAALVPRVRDVTELLAEHLPGPRRPLDLTVTYHEPCHLAHGQRVRAAPRAILRAIPGLRFVELAESDLCCGSAGVYNLMEPEIAGQLLNRKLDRIGDTGAGIVATGNPGCLLQLRRGLADRGLAVRAYHPIELLAWSVEGACP